MAYHTTPFFKHIKLTKGWKHSLFPQNALNYSRDVTLYLKIYLLLKAYLHLKYLLLIFCEIRVLANNLKLLHLAITKTSSGKPPVRTGMRPHSLWRSNSPMLKPRHENAVLYIYGLFPHLAKRILQNHIFGTHKICNQLWLNKSRVTTWLNFLNFNKNLKRLICKHHRVYNQRINYLRTSLRISDYKIFHNTKFDVSFFALKTKYLKYKLLLSKLQKDSFFLEQFLRTLKLQLQKTNEVTNISNDFFVKTYQIFHKKFLYKQQMIKTILSQFQYILFDITKCQQQLCQIKDITDIKPLLNFQKTLQIIYAKYQKKQLLKLNKHLQKTKIYLNSTYLGLNPNFYQYTKLTSRLFKRTHNYQLGLEISENTISYLWKIYYLFLLNIQFMPSSIFLHNKQLEYNQYLFLLNTKLFNKQNNITKYTKTFSKMSFFVFKKFINQIHKNKDVISSQQSTKLIQKLQKIFIFCLTNTKLNHHFIRSFIHKKKFLNILSFKELAFIQRRHQLPNTKTLYTLKKKRKNINFFFYKINRQLQPLLLKNLKKNKISKTDFLKKKNVFLNKKLKTKLEIVIQKHLTEKVLKLATLAQGNGKYIKYAMMTFQKNVQQQYNVDPEDTWITTNSKVIARNILFGTIMSVNKQLLLKKKLYFSKLRASKLRQKWIKKIKKRFLNKFTIKFNKNYIKNIKQKNVAINNKIMSQKKLQQKISKKDLLVNTSQKIKWAYNQRHLSSFQNIKNIICKDTKYIKPFRQEYQQHLSVLTKYRLRYLLQEFLQKHLNIHFCIKFVNPIKQGKNLNFFRLLYPKKNVHKFFFKKNPAKIRKNIRWRFKRIKEPRYIYLGTKSLKFKTLQTNYNKTCSFLSYKKRWHLRNWYLKKVRNKRWESLWQKKKAISKFPRLNKTWIANWLLFAKLLDPQLLADQIARLFDTTNKHWLILNALRFLLRYLPSKRGLQFRIGLFGKISKSTRTKAVYITKHTMPTQKFVSYTNYAAAQSQGRVGAIGVKVWIGYA